LEWYATQRATVNTIHDRIPARIAPVARSVNTTKYVVVVWSAEEVTYATILDHEADA